MTQDKQQIIVSFIVPAYNSETTLRKCLNSFLNPAVSDEIEVIVINDGSTDSTPHIASEYAAEYRFFQLINKENGGHGSAINYAKAIAGGKYFKVIDSDDWVQTANLPAYIESLKSTDADVVFTHFRTIDSRDGHIRDYNINNINFGNIYSFDDYWKHKQNVFQTCCFHGITYNTDFYRGYNIELSEKVSYEDQEFSTLPFAHVRTVLPLDIYLYEYSIGNPNQSMSDSNQVKRLQQREQILRKLLDAATPDLSPAASDYFMFKNRDFLLAYYMAALIKNPNKPSGRKAVRKLRDNLEKQGAQSLLEASHKQYVICFSISYLGRFGNVLLNLRRFSAIRDLAVRIRGGEKNRAQPNTDEGRLAFYGWTDYLLLNLVNAKESHYPHERSDLFVFNLNRVSAKLVEAIAESRVFENVYLIEPMHKSALTSTKDKFLRLFTGRKYYKYYAAQLESLVGHRKYKSFFTGAFWSETLHLARYFFKSSPQMEINFVEEGTAAYLEIDYLKRCMPRGGVKEIIIRYMHYAKSYKCACRQLNGLFLYQPVVPDSKVSLMPLTAISETVLTEHILRQVSESIDIKPYSDALFNYCISSNVNGIEGFHSKNVAILQNVCEIVHPPNVLVRLHPDITESDAAAYKNYYAKLFVETASGLFEGVMLHVDISNKTLISEGSTALITPKLLFNKEPYIVMTHRLYKDYPIYGNQKADAWFNLIYSLYHNKLRVSAPETEDELRETIFSLKNRIFASGRSAVAGLT